VCTCSDFWQPILSAVGMEHNSIITARLITANRTTVSIHVTKFLARARGVVIIIIWWHDQRA